MNVSLLLPSRMRPDMLARMYDSAMGSADDPDNVEVVVYIDNDDNSYDNLSRSNLVKVRGERIVLSQMWNECWKNARGEYFGHMGDDVIFRTKGWDTQIIYAFPTDKIAFVHGRDGSDQDKIHFGTHGFVHRKWTDVVGYFVPPYFSCDYNDTWLNEVADKIGRHVFVEDVLIEHMHPAWKKRETDATDNERIQRGDADNVRHIYDSKDDERESDAEKLMDYISR